MLIYLVILNAAGLLLMLLDKIFAIKKKRRIPESTLLLCALIGGSLGALSGMVLFRHKTKHRRFAIGLPLMLLAHILFYIFFILL